MPPTPSHLIKMSFGPLGWRSTSSSSKNPRLAGLGKSTGSSSNRLSLATSSPISRSLTSLPFGGSAVDQYIASASNYSSTPTYRRSPHVRRGSSSQPSSTANRLRASSHTNISSLPNNSSTQTYAVIGLLILSFVFTCDTFHRKLFGTPFVAESTVRTLCTFHSFLPFSLHCIVQLFSVCVN